MCLSSLLALGQEENGSKFGLTLILVPFTVFLMIRNFESEKTKFEILALRYGLSTFNQDVLVRV